MVKDWRLRTTIIASDCDESFTHPEIHSVDENHQEGGLTTIAVICKTNLIDDSLDISRSEIRIAVRRPSKARQRTLEMIEACRICGENNSRVDNRNI
jgi:hypothetical protein